MPLAAAQEPFVFTDLPELSIRSLRGLLADRLPDDFGNALIDAWMARHGVDKGQVTPLRWSASGNISCCYRAKTEREP